MKKYEFLTNISLDDARQKMIDAVRAADIPVATEMVKVREANNCVTARAHYAVRSSPHYVASAMDGIAVLASKTVGATEGTKSRYAFVFGDFRRVHRSALIACVFRAAQWRHKAVELAAHELLQRLDAASGLTAD